MDQSWPRDLPQATQHCPTLQRLHPCPRVLDAGRCRYYSHFRKDSRLYSYPIAGQSPKLYNLLPHPKGPSVSLGAWAGQTWWLPEVLPGGGGGGRSSGWRWRLRARGPGRRVSRGLCAQGAALPETADPGGEGGREERGRDTGGAKRAGAQERLTGGGAAPIWIAEAMVSPGDLRWRRWEEGWRLLEISLCPKRPRCPPRPHLTAQPPPIPPPPTGPGRGALPPLEPGPAIRVTRAFPLGKGSRTFPPSRSEPGSQGRVSGLEPQTQAPVPEPEVHTGHVTIVRSHC